MKTIYIIILIFIISCGSDDTSSSPPSPPSSSSRICFQNNSSTRFDIAGTSARGREFDTTATIGLGNSCLDKVNNTGYTIINRCLGGSGSMQLQYNNYIITGDRSSCSIQRAVNTPIYYH